MALSWGGEESGAGSFVDGVHIEVGGPSGKKEVNAINDVEEAGDGGITGFEVGDVGVSPVGEFIAD